MVPRGDEPQLSAEGDEWAGRITYPRHGPPGDVVAHGFEVDHGYGGDRGRGQALVRVRRVRGRQDRDDDHVAAHQQRAAEERAPPPDPLHEEQQEE